jgi:mannobiose 2-epimerase
LELLAGELSAGLQGGILPFWQHLSDLVNGGYYGRVDAGGFVHKQADRGAAMYSGIMWAFSAAYNLLGDENYLIAARAAGDYLLDHFFDHEHGGVYWTVNRSGKPSDTGKHLYAQNMAIRGLCEFHKATGEQRPLNVAARLTEMLETHVRDPRYGGYTEVHERDWSVAADECAASGATAGDKQLFTQLRVLDSYTMLYALRPSSQLADRLTELVELLCTRMFDAGRSRLGLTFDADWTHTNGHAGYGGLILASWLLDRAGDVLGAPGLLTRTVEQFALLSLEGLQQDGSVMPLCEPVFGQQGAAWQWRLQAQAMTGYFNMYRKTGMDRWLVACLRLWKYINDRLVDPRGGEWFPGVDRAGEPLQWADKAGVWKSPDASARMCVEIILMISKQMR